MLHFCMDDRKGFLVSKNLVPNELCMGIVSNYIQRLLGLHCLETEVFYSFWRNICKCCVYFRRTPLDFISWAGRWLLSNP